MRIWGDKIAILAWAALLASCATVAKPPAPDFSDTHLRPINQDLVAWLDRLNAGTGTDGLRPLPASPAAAAVPAASPRLPAPASAPPVAAPSAAPNAIAASVAAAFPIPSSNPVAPSPSPGAPAPAAASPPNPPASAVAAAADANSIPATRKGPPSPDAVVEAPKPPPAKPAPLWAAEPTQTLRSSVEAWAAREHWTVIWNADVDYRIAAHLEYRGDFVAAVNGIFKDHENAKVPLRAVADTTHKQLTVSE